MKNGFTLIELLVVIAIIGILASVVLLRYPITIEKVKDSRVLTALSQFRMQAGILKTMANDYGAVSSCVVASGECSCGDVSLNVLCADAQKNSDQDFVINVNDVDKNGFCLVAHLQGEGKYFCVDGDLRAKMYDDSPAQGAGTCVVGCKAAKSCRCE
jgi:prepilin-type N-terminal cleavage/methylation domain-containing protein